ncbi:hypothetical protein EMPS_03892 [Entomortierella parvispora]|uniref:Uncharacterized protein n=1 Tax=Entomortierella parvispora TaxID=205924 RepID=A0A9P3LV10_9FUNG|nr:hypothetical protein EMPS_03892 [Entomortierella parvispora]
MSSANNDTSFICQESFLPNNVSTCLRYIDTPSCVQTGRASHLNFVCVVADPHVIGVSGFSLPQPDSLTSSPFLCTLQNCPIRAQDYNATASGVAGTNAGTAASKVSKSSLTFSSVLVLVLLASQVALF